VFYAITLGDDHPVLCVHGAQHTHAENKMLDFLFILGQAASAMLLIYGGFLALIPANTALSTKRAPDEMSVLHLRTHA
jgi:hypothetical protein